MKEIPAIDYSLDHYKTEAGHIYSELLFLMKKFKDAPLDRKLAGIKAGQSLGAAKKRLMAGHFFRLLDRLKSDSDITVTVHVAIALGARLVGRKFNARTLVKYAGKTGKRANNKVNVGEELEKILALPIAQSYIHLLERDVEKADKFRELERDVYLEKLKASKAL